MALPSVTSANYPTAKELLDQCLADIRYSYASRGIEANVLPGSDHYVRAETYCNRAAIALANNKLALRNFSPLTATGDDLINLAAAFGVSKRPADGASGYVNCYGTAGAVTIPAGYQGTSPSGHKYQVPAATTVTLVGQDDNAGAAPTVYIEAVKNGDSTNQTAGTTLSWDSSSIGALKATCKVDAGALTGGTDEDDDEDIRARLLRKLSAPTADTNSSRFAELAEEASASIQQAYVYPAVRGPGSVDIALVKDTGDRTLGSTVTTAVSAYVAAAMGGHADLNVTSVNAQYVDVVINLTLPLPASAGGSGSGWKDATPWPSTTDSTLVRVTASSSNTLTVNATSSQAPVAGNRFCLWNPSLSAPDSAAMTEFEIISVSGSSGAYVLTVSSVPGWVSALTPWLRVSPAAENMSSYADAIYTSIKALGPGEKTSAVEILPRGRRYPAPDIRTPNALTTIQLSALTTQFAEVLNAEYAARYDTATTTDRTSPSLPSAVADAPRILVLKHLAFRRTVT